jgi:hypothetical protein
MIVSLIHFYNAVTHTPEYTPIHKMTPKMNFEKIRTVGRVSDIKLVEAEYGQHVVKLELTDEKARANTPRTLRTITAKLEGEAASDYLAWENPPGIGDRVEVAASLYAGDGYRHLSVSAIPFIRILERAFAGQTGPGEAAAGKPEVLSVTIPQLLAQPERFRDQTVSLPEVEVIYAEAGSPFFRARDLTETNQNLVIMGYKGPPLSVGQQVSVRGQFVFYAKKNYWEIMIPRSDTRAVTVLPAEATGR